jgi:hypothetical protein
LLGDVLKEDYREDDFRPDGFCGTLAPLFRASERPMAMACLRLFTVPPFPPGPDLSVPFFFRRIADSTDLPAASPYFPLPDDFFVAAIWNSPQFRVRAAQVRGLHQAQ